MVEIVDQKSAEAWLEGKRQEVQVAFAARCALRALPAIARADSAALGEIALPVMRAVLLSAVAGRGLKFYRGLKDYYAATSAAASAGFAASAAPSAAASARSACSAAFCAAGGSPATARCAAAFSAASGSAASRSAASADASRLDAEESPQLLFRHGIWGDTPVPKGLQTDYHALRVFWGEDPVVWGFWERWYEGMLAGHPLDWDLQREVALIPDDDWKKGPEHIARLIAEIEARFLANTLAERIELAPSGRLTLVPQEFPQGRHLGLLIDTVRDALDLATSGLRNELPEDAYQVRLLRQTFARYGNDPQRIEMDFERARVSLIEDIAADAIPASAPNRDLVQALSDAAGAIRDSDADIARNRERLNRIRLGQVSPEDAARIAEAAEQVAEISEGVLRDDLLEDRFHLPGFRRGSGVPDPVVPLGAAERNAALEAQAAQLRLYSRLAKVLLFLKAHDREIALVGSLASIVGLIVAVVAL